MSYCEQINANARFFYQRGHGNLGKVYNPITPCALIDGTKWHARNDTYKDKTEIYAKELCKIPAQICTYTSEFEMSFTVLSVGFKKSLNNEKHKFPDSTTLILLWLNQEGTSCMCLNTLIFTIVHKVVQ